MESLTANQKEKLADFFNNLAVAWLTTSVIVPTFTLNFPWEAKMLYFMAGGSMAYFFVKKALELSS
jgi:hypothetical protein